MAWNAWMGVSGLLLAVLITPCELSAADVARNPVVAQTTAIASSAPLPAWVNSIESALSTVEAVDAVVQYRLTDAGRERETVAEQNGTFGAEDVKQALVQSRTSLMQYFQATGITVVRVYDYQPLILVHLSEIQARDLAARPEVVNVHLNELFSRHESVSRTDSIAEREMRAEAVDGERTQDSNTDGYVNADKAWAKGFTGKGYAVAILDDGINASHEMFTGKIIAEACFSDPGTTNASLCPSGAKTATGSGAASSACSSTLSVCQHGSHVAGIAAGNNHGTIFVDKGVAPDANIVAVQVFHKEASPNCGGDSTCLRASNFDIAAALDWLIANAATYNVVAVNMSLGSGTYSLYCDSDSLLTDGINTLRRMNVLTVVSAGNDGELNVVSHPACIKAAVAVSSSIITVPDSTVNQSPLVSLLAPGVLVFSADGVGASSYVTLSGTSMAAPHVTGAIAVLKQSFPSATADQLEYAMVSTGPLESFIGWTWKTPLLDVNAALGSVTATPPPTGIALMSLLSGAMTTGNSYLRFVNTDSIKGHVSLTLYEDSPKTKIGIYSLDVPAKASVQVTLKDIETAMGSQGITQSLETAYVDTDFKGFVQNIIWNPQGQALTNLTSCTSTGNDPKTLAANVHTSLLSSTYPSIIAVFNTGLAAATAGFDIYDAATGNKLGSIQTSSPVQPNTSTVFNADDALNAIQFTPSQGQYHVNFQLQPGFTGIVQHVVNNKGAGVLTDMTVKCPLQ